MASTVDVLFVDEAGQMSLANVLAISQAATSIVLLRDPQQLDQPQKGVHPPGAEVSALGHLLNGRATISADQGLFLTETRRLHPDICTFTSEIFYDGRLVSRPENSKQRHPCGRDRPIRSSYVFAGRNSFRYNVATGGARAYEIRYEMPQAISDQERTIRFAPNEPQLSRNLDEFYQFDGRHTDGECAKAQAATLAGKQHR